MVPAELLKARLREDLRAAMKSRQRDIAGTLRSLIAEIDNAEAVPAGDAHARYESVPFGAPGAETERRALTAVDLRLILARDIAARRAAADDMERHGETSRADLLRMQAALAERYLPED